MANRVFLIVLDSFGIGGAPDADRFNDEGSNTLAAVLSYSDRPFPNLEKMGLLALPHWFLCTRKRALCGKRLHDRPLGDRRHNVRQTPAHISGRIPR